MTLKWDNECSGKYAVCDKSHGCCKECGPKCEGPNKYLEHGKCKELGCEIGICCNECEEGCEKYMTLKIDTRCSDHPECSVEHGCCKECPERCYQPGYDFENDEECVEECIKDEDDCAGCPGPLEPLRYGECGELYPNCKKGTCCIEKPNSGGDDPEFPCMDAWGFKAKCTIINKKITITNTVMTWTVNDATTT